MPFLIHGGASELAWEVHEDNATLFGRVNRRTFDIEITGLKLMNLEIIIHVDD